MKSVPSIKVYASAKKYIRRLSPHQHYLFLFFFLIKQINFICFSFSFSYFSSANRR